TNCSSTWTPTMRACSWRPSVRARSTPTTRTSGRGALTSSRRRWSTPARGSRRRQAEVPLPLGRRGALRVPRLLLGVSGGIAAYKALELVRLATREGHAVRVIQTRTAQRFVGAASFAALSGAPVLSSEFERDPLRGSFPGDPLPTHDPASHLALSAAADVLLIAPASANTIA